MFHTAHQEGLAEVAYTQFNGRGLVDIVQGKLAKVRQSGSARFSEGSSYAHAVPESLVYLPLQSEEGWGRERG